MSEPSVHIAFVKAALHSLRSQKALCRQLLLDNQLPADVFALNEGRVRADRFADLVQDIMIALNDEQLGYGEEPQSLGTWVTMVQLASNGSTLHEALRRLARFYRLVPWGIDTQLSVSGDVARFTMNNIGGHRVSPYLYESFLFYVYRFCNCLLEQQIPLMRVDFAFDRPDYSGEYSRLYHTSAVHFSQPSSALVFPAYVLEEPLSQGDQALRALISHPNRALILQDYMRQTWSNQVRKYLSMHLTENPGVDQVAAALGMHPHTLRRRLGREGSRFNQLREQLRQEMALTLLDEEVLSVEAIALALGYSETSAFSRAFKRWRGVSPQHFQIGSKAR